MGNRKIGAGLWTLSSAIAIITAAFNETSLEWFFLALMICGAILMTDTFEKVQ